MPTNDVHAPTRAAPPLDAVDRKILGLLSDDAGRGYADLAREIGLSTAATHERVKRLRARGAIKGVTARLDPKAVDKPLLAFVHVDTSGWGKSPELIAIGSHPEVEEIHTVAGDACLILKVRVADPEALEGLLAKLYGTPGVRATRTYVALTSVLERGVQAASTDRWPTPSYLVSAERDAADRSA